MGGLLGHRGLLLAGTTGGGVTDPDFASVTCLLHFDGTDGSTSFVDVKGNTWTPRGNAQIDTAQSKYGGASGLFDGSGDMLSGPNDAGFNFATGMFTVEAWIYLDSITGAYQAIFSRFSQGGGSGNGGLGFYVNPAGKLEASRAGVSTIGVGATTLTTGTWHHVAVTKDAVGAGNIKMWLNGVQDFTTAFSNTLSESASGTPGIGGFWNGTVGGQSFDGWIDDFRITKGVCRYTGTFTPPTVFPDA